MKILREILHGIAVPFASLVLVMKLWSCNRWLKKYEKADDAYTIEERYKKVRSFCSLAIFIKGANVVSSGREKLANKQMLYLVNHKGNIDPLVILKLIMDLGGSNPIFIGKIELEKAKFASPMKLIDTIFIDRDNLRQIHSTIEKQNKYIKEGRSIVVFPEGTRSAKDEFGEFKSGCLHPAYTNLIAIQPIVLFNSGGWIEKEDSLGNVYPKRKSHDLKAEICDPIQASKFINIDSEIFTQTIRTQMISVYDKLANESNKTKTKK